MDHHQSSDQPPFAERPPDRRRIVVLSLMAILVVAFLLRFPPCLRYLHVDERMVLENVLKFIKERTVVPAHYQYPTFFSYIAAPPTVLWSVVLSAMGRYDSPADVMAMRYLDSIVAFFPLRLTSLVLGLATIWMVFLLGRKHFDVRTGLLAAAILTCSYVHVERSALGLPDAATAFLATGAFHAILSAFRSDKRRLWVLAGLLVGLATATKYNAGLLVCSLLTAHVLRLKSDGKLRVPRLWINASLLLSGLTVVVTFFIASPAWLIQPRIFFDTFLLQAAHSKQGVMGVYKTPYAGWLVQAWQQESALAVAMLIGLLYALIRRRGKDMILAMTVLPAIITIGAGRYGGLHYFLFAYPATALLASRALLQAWDSLAPKPAARIGLVATGMVSFLRPIIHVAQYAVLSLIATDSRLEAQNWINQNLPAGSRIALDPVDVPKLRAEGRSGLLEGERAAFFKERLKTFRPYRLSQVPCETAGPGDVDADYMVLSNAWYDRFKPDPPPPASPFHKAHAAAKRFYADLFDTSGSTGWTLAKTFDTGNGPRILIYQRLRPTTTSAAPTSR